MKNSKLFRDRYENLDNGYPHETVHEHARPLEHTTRVLTTGGQMPTPRNPREPVPSLLNEGSRVVRSKR